jgi:hypothetical protein
MVLCPHLGRLLFRHRSCSSVSPLVPHVPCGIHAWKIDARMWRLRAPEVGAPMSVSDRTPVMVGVVRENDTDPYTSVSGDLSSRRISRIVSSPETSSRRCLAMFSMSCCQPFQFRAIASGSPRGLTGTVRHTTTERHGMPPSAMFAQPAANTRCAKGKGSSFRPERRSNIRSGVVTVPRSG